MIYFDVTKTAAVRHRSGLARLSERLRDELGAGARPIGWTDARDHAAPDDWFVTTELFSEAERPGFTTFLRSHRCRTAAVFADAIPLKLPHVTWPQSVARHPSYLKLLASFERVWAISVASRDELVGYWRWLGLEAPPPVEVLPLGADLDRQPRVTAAAETPPPGRPAVLCLGILEPRKNQQFLLTVCAELWSAGHVFDVHIVGRVNPHFGQPIVELIKRLRKRWPGLHYHAAIDDARLDQLFRSVRATVCPTIAEGCGLPLLESLWHGVPCVCSDLPVLRENADGGGCLPAAVNDPAAWRDALLRVLFDDRAWQRLQAEAARRVLPTWAETAQRLRQGLR
jgi:glycosyltransferase involved in cell wall biosynthesis